MKDCVFRNCVDDSDYMRERVMETIQSVTNGMLTCKWIELVYGLDVIKTTRRPPFEAEYGVHQLSELRKNLQNVIFLSLLVIV